MDKGLLCHSLKQDFGSLFFRFSDNYILEGTDNKNNRGFSQ